MKIKNAFTLIELLTVIIILSLLMLLVTPIITDLINDSIEKVNRTNVNELIETARTYNTAKTLEGGYVADENVNILELLDYSGVEPEDGNHGRYGVYIDSLGNVAIAVAYGEKCYTKYFYDSIIRKADISAITECFFVPRFPLYKKLLLNTVTTGTGLYTVSSTNYVYKSDASAAADSQGVVTANAQPNNYVNFNNDIWRIISIENNRLKLISEDINSFYSIDAEFSVPGWQKKSLQWDTGRNVANTYCDSASGCNLWVGLSTGTFNSVNMATYPVAANSSLYDYLNSDLYYTSLLSSISKTMIDNSTWYYGAYVNNSTDFTTINANSISSKVGLMNIKEYIDASNSLACTAGQVACNNWLNNAAIEFTINATTSDQESAVCILSDGSVNYCSTIGTIYGIRPVVVLKSNVIIVGDGIGTLENPYNIETLAE